MNFEPWMLTAMEEHGHTTTNMGHINRVAHCLAKSPNDEINNEEFRSACYACDVDPDSFTQKDLDQLQRKLNQIT